MRIFLDTNVLVAAFATRGLCADLLRLVLQHHDLVVTPVVLAELERALESKFGLPSARVAEARDFLSACLVETVEGPAERLALRDPSDVAVVRSAIAAHADLIVSGDRDLLEASLPLPAITPRQLWEQVREPNRGEVHEPESRYPAP